MRCPSWFSHAQVFSRLDSMWRAWETLRWDGAMGMSNWWLHHVDPYVSALLDPVNGPFARCGEGHQRDEPLPIELVSDGCSINASGRRRGTLSPWTDRARHVSRRGLDIRPATESSDAMKRTHCREPQRLSRLRSDVVNAYFTTEQCPSCGCHTDGLSNRFACTSCDTVWTSGDPDSVVSPRTSVM
ncbi:DUF4913 domain-containing protein [Streptomyces sp. NPDC055134]